jgi:hypothetical protein
VDEVRADAEAKSKAEMLVVEHPSNCAQLNSRWSKDKVGYGSANSSGSIKLNA